eukprot:12417071-Karenia_brevis.AAC.1
MVSCSNATRSRKRSTQAHQGQAVQKQAHCLAPNCCTPAPRNSQASDQTAPASPVALMDDQCPQWAPPRNNDFTCWDP